MEFPKNEQKYDRETIQQSGKLFLIGPRRYGKTSILKAAEDRLRPYGAVPLRYDAESYASLDLLVNAIVTGAARQLKGSIERTGEKIRQFFSRLRPELHFSVSEREWSVRSTPSVRKSEVCLFRKLESGVSATCVTKCPAASMVVFKVSEALYFLRKKYNGDTDVHCNALAKRLGRHSR